MRPHSIAAWSVFLSLALATTVLQVRELRRCLATDVTAHLKLLQEAAPVLRLPNSAGQIVKLDDVTGKYALVSFWASWCAPCRLELPALAGLVRDWNHNPENRRQLVYFAVNVGEDPKDVTEITGGPRFGEVRFLFDENQQTSSTWGVNGVPTVFLVNAKGRVVFSHEGFSPDLAYNLRQELERAEQQTAGAGGASERRP